MSAHTPGPLRVLQNSKDDSEATQFLIATDGTERVVVLAKVARAADADELVRRFNAHDDLLAALRAARRQMTNQLYNQPRIGMEVECAMADAAIAKAEGKS